MSNVPLLGLYMEGIVKEMLEEYVDEYVEEYVKLIREVVEDNYAQGAVDTLVERLLKLRDTINENPEYAIIPNQIHGRESLGIVYFMMNYLLLVQI